MELIAVVVAIVAAMSLVGFDLDVYIIGALLIWRFILMEEDSDDYLPSDIGPH